MGTQLPRYGPVARAVAAALPLALVPGPAAAAEALLGPSATLTLSAVGVALLAIGLGIVGLASRRALAADNAALERENRALRQRWTRAERLLAVQPHGLFVWPTTDPDPEVRGIDRASLAQALGGPQGESLARAIAELRRSGSPFDMTVTGTDGARLRAQGGPAGAAVGVWLTRLPEEAGVAARMTTEAARLRALLDALPAPVWRRDAQGRLDYANPAFAHAAGQPDPAALIAQQVSLDRREAQLARDARTRGQLTFEKRYVIVGGQRRALMLLARPAGADVAGMALDITPIEDAEQRLQTLRDAQDETLNKLKTAVAVFGADQRLLFYNRAYAVLWGLDPQWLDTRPSDGEILERLRSARKLPEQRDFAAWKRQRLQLYQQRTPVAVDEDWHLPDNTTIRVMGQPHPLGGLLFLYDDVTNELTLQRKYNTLITVQKETLDTLSEGVVVFGPDGGLQLWNAAFARIWRLNPPHLSTQPHFREVAAQCEALLPEREAWEWIGAHVTGFSTERRIESRRFTRRDGCVIEMAVVPLPDGATLISSVDVTDTVRAEQRLIERNEALEAADRVKTQFVQHVSYQLRTPLATILGFAEMLDQDFAGPMSPRQKDYLGNILSGAASLRGLIADILDLAVIDAGEAELDTSEIEAAELLRGMLPLVRERADHAGVSLSLDVAETAGVIRADLRRVKQAIFNLLSNAIAYSPTGGVVTLTARPTETGVAISVSDLGPGIAPEYQARVFERFESRKTAGSRGAGLGLALVKSFIELHGGIVTLESRPGAGTTVTCHLPRQPAPPRRVAA